MSAHVLRDPRHCPHMRITRIVDSYVCLDCGTEFLPKDKTLHNKWSDCHECLC